MPNLILELDVNRVDVVDEGSNSEAYIKLYKRKESAQTMELNEILGKLQPEHAQVVRDEIAKAKGEVPAEVVAKVAKAVEDLKTMETECVKAKKDFNDATVEIAKLKGSASAPTEEEILKSLDPAVQEVMKSAIMKRDAAEAALKLINEQTITESAVAKAKECKALPIEEAKLVSIMKGATPEVYEILKAASVLIEKGPAFVEIGKGGSSGNKDAWSQIEKKASDIVVRDKISLQAAIGLAVKENPDLYRAYVNGGAN